MELREQSKMETLERKIFFADYKNGDSGAMGKAQNQRLQKCRETLCPASLYFPSAWHTPYILAVPTI
jgi:hypothetical protein